MYYADNWLIDSYRSSSDITIREGTRGIAEGVLIFSEIEELKLPESLVNIGMMSIVGTGLKSLTIPDNTNNLGIMSFALSPALEEVTIGSNVETIPIMAFTGCEALKTVTIPKSVKNIEFAAFLGCPSLTDIYYGGTEAEWNAVKRGAYMDEFNNATVHFASVAESTYSLGDLNGDSAVNATDAAILLSAAAVAGTGGDSGLNEEQIKFADLSGDGAFDAVDAAIILQFAAYKGAGGTDPIETFVAAL